jgi:hypothetical protein
MGNAQWKWQELYLNAFLETNPLNLSGRVVAAEKAIALRTTELRTSSEGELEWQAIGDAMKGLSILKREIKRAIGINAITHEQHSKAAFKPNHRARPYVGLVR